MELLQPFEKALQLYGVEAPTIKLESNLARAGYYYFSEKMIKLSRELLKDDDLLSVIAHELAHHIASIIYNEPIEHDKRFVYVLLNIIKTTNIDYNWNIEYKKVLKEKRTLERMGAI